MREDPAEMEPQKPPWLRIRAPTDPRFQEIRALLDEMDLRTVCTASRCPNIGECWSGGHATFMIMGETCTRSCGFCAVASGRGEPLDLDEGARIARAVARLGLDHVVITSVTRDDLPDGGAAQFASVVNEIRRASGTSVELLIPDLGGSEQALRTIVEAGPDIVGHNLETVRRLQPLVRDRRASYDLSLRVLRSLGREDGLLTKSSLMLGLGERLEEVEDAMTDMYEAGVDILTLGQYLRPRGGRLSLVEYVPPSQFEMYRRMGLEMGFRFVASGPLVRSSYRAGEVLESVRGE